MKKNNISTQGYFLKRLRDSGYVAIKMFDGYSMSDSRKWTIMVDPGGVSLLITCHENREYNGDVMFEFSDGGHSLPRTFLLKTDSMEVIITRLVEWNIAQLSDGNSYVKLIK